MKVYWLLATMLVSGLLSAQQSGSFKKFGFQAGANTGNMNFNQGSPPPAVKIDPSWKTGVTLGFMMRVPLGNRWWLQPEYNFAQRNGADKSINTNYQLDYLSLPLLVHYKICNQLSVYAGPQGELLIHASSTNNNVKTNITHDTEERSLAAIAGLEYNFIKSIFVSARYMQGFNHIGIGQRSSVKEFKYEAIALTAGIYF